MKRNYGRILGWILIIAGAICVWLLGFKPAYLAILFFGFFFRLIYNSEKHKYFKYMETVLRIKNAHPYDIYTIYPIQRKALYKSAIDFIAVIVLPFFIVPRLNLPWYVDSLIAIIYVIAVMHIFRDMDEQDRNEVDNLINEHYKTTNNE